MSSHSSNTPRRGYSRGNNRHSNSKYSSNSRQKKSDYDSANKGKVSFWSRILGLLGLSPNGKCKKSCQSSEPTAQQKNTSRSAIRNPDVNEVTTPRVYVGNLAFETTEGDLTELFSGVGTVQNTEVICNRYTNRSKGFGFVQMQTVEEACRAVSELHDKEYMGRRLVVSGARALDRSLPEAE